MIVEGMVRSELGGFSTVSIVVLIISAFQLLRSIAVVEGVSFEVVGTA